MRAIDKMVKLLEAKENFLRGGGGGIIAKAVIESVLIEARSLAAEKTDDGFVTTSTAKEWAEFKEWKWQKQYGPKAEKTDEATEKGLREELKQVLEDWEINGNPMQKLELEQILSRHPAPADKEPLDVNMPTICYACDSSNGKDKCWCDKYTHDEGEQFCVLKSRLSDEARAWLEAQTDKGGV